MAALPKLSILLCFVAAIQIKRSFQHKSERCEKNLLNLIIRSLAADSVYWHLAMRDVAVETPGEGGRWVLPLHPPMSSRAGPSPAPTSNRSSWWSQSTNAKHTARMTKNENMNGRRKKLEIHIIYIFN